MNHRGFTYSQQTISWGLFLFSFIFYILNLNFESSGDTIYYANIIDTLSLEHLTAHQGYYAIALTLKALLGLFISLPTDQVLTIMSALFAAGSLTIAYHLLNFYLNSYRYAMLGILILFLCHRYYDNATSGEIYIVQTFFIWCSYLSYEKKRFYSAGIFISFALWITPLTVAFGAWFLVAAYIRGYGLLSLVRMGIPVLFLYLPFLLMFYEELFWGNRGLIDQDNRRYLDLIEGGKNFFAYQFKHYTFLNLLIIPAAFSLKEERKLLLLTLAAALPNIYVISQLREEDNVFILALDVLFVCWFIIGFRTLRNTHFIWLANIALVFQIIIFLITEQPFYRPSNISYGDEIRAIGKIVSSTEKPLLFADWTRRMAYVYFNRDQAYYPLEEGYWYDQSFDTGIIKRKIRQYEPNDFSQYKNIFVIERWNASPHAKLFLSTDIIQQRYETHSRKRTVERLLNIECKPISNEIQSLYHCS